MMPKTMTITPTTTLMRTMTTTITITTMTLQCEGKQMLEIKMRIKTSEGIANVSHDYAK